MEWLLGHAVHVHRFAYPSIRNACCISMFTLPYFSEEIEKTMVKNRSFFVLNSM